jgi:hypothetical protein
MPTMPRRAAPPVLPQPALSLAHRQAGVITAAQLLAHGVGYVEQRSLVRDLQLTGLGRGVLSLADAPDVLERRVVVATLGSGEPGVAGLQTAAALLQWRDPWPRDDVHLWLPGDAKRHQRRAGVRLHWTYLLPEEVLGGHPLQWTSPARTAWDVLRRWSRDEAIALMDSALHRQKLDPALLAEVAERLPRSRRPWVQLIDPRSESWLETKVRLFLHANGLYPDLQVELMDGQRVVARFDLGFRAQRVAIECDGRDPHDAVAALYRDRHRDDDVRQYGWRIVRVTWEDLRLRPADVLRRVLRALALAA